MSGLWNVGYFLITLFFSLALFLLWVRIGLRYHRISRLNSIYQVVYTTTHPLTAPLEFLFHLSPKQRCDWPSVIALVILECIKFLLIGWMITGEMLPVLTMAVMVVGDLMILPCQILFYALLFRILLSWLAPMQSHPMIHVLYTMTNPLIQFASRYVPPIAGVDFSPFLMMVLFKVITLFVSGSLPFHI